MSHILVELMSKLTRLTSEEELAIEESFPIRTFEKRALLISEGQTANNAYYVISGCIREYMLIDGEERTINFFTEEQSVINFDSLANGTPSKQNYECTEQTTVAVLNLKKEQELYARFPRFETFCRTGMEKMMGEKQSQLAEFVSLQPAQRYQKLQEERPDLINRVPQYQIASYLGIKPETLSRIRKKLTAK
ncbi:Crp/Fnr family transcriptional regulator [Zhouia spongiae]|uniref:Crp/Fnr family transcriptional regulator n=1 Tax=Zhouia spongiae TaxID=2202721 RepID=A0ABY3YNG3_9FLAO|nr:Crp/Fnr family transcriptional regulator [Zhouia spongiae]UNY99221.1 Crp/Fnr family transcriptional regulator [Zhouia spongiae]